MGRVSAGIAHEIRNPLAAIAQANALLSEDATDPAQRQLMRMVTENVERLKRIVDDVMEVAPGHAQDVGSIDATAQLAAVCSEWAQAAGLPLGEHSVLRVELPAEPLGVIFDAEHLRRVLVNLLDNARRHASQRPGAITAARCAPSTRRSAEFSVVVRRARRSRPTSNPICSSRFSRPAAAARAWAFTFAASSARDTGRASTTGCCRPTRRAATTSSSPCDAPPCRPREARLHLTP